MFFHFRGAKVDNWLISKLNNFKQWKYYTTHKQELHQLTTCQKETNVHLQPATVVTPCERNVQSVTRDAQLDMIGLNTGTTLSQSSCLWHRSCCRTTVTTAADTDACRTSPHAYDRQRTRSASATAVPRAPGSAPTHEEKRRLQRWRLRRGRR